MQIKNIINNEFIKNISTLAFGTILAQLIPIALQPFLRRQFTPEDYGAFSVYLSLVGILIIVSSFKYELAIILPKKRKEAGNILFLSQFINLIFNVFLFLIILIWQQEIAVFLNLKGVYAKFIYFVPLGTLLYNLYISLNYWLIREKKFGIISKNKIIRRGTEGAIQIGFSMFRNSSGLLYGDILGNLVNVLMGIKQTKKNSLYLKYLSIIKLKYVLKKYSEYPRFNLIPGLMSAASFLLPAILINKFYSMEYAGFYDLSRMVLSIPMALIAASVSNVLLQKINEHYVNNKSLKKILTPLSIIIISIATIEIVVLSIWAENIFAFVFGEINKLSGKITEILVWSDALSFITATFSSVYIAMKKIKFLSVWQIFYFILIISLFFLNNFNFFNFLKYFVAIKTFGHFISLLIIIYIIISYEKKISKNNTAKL